MSHPPSGADTTVRIPYIDAVSATTSGLVTTVSFYANNGCNDNEIYFGAFEALSSLSSSAEFQLKTQSGIISVDRSSSSSSMQRVDISLCVLPNTPTGCQANAFYIDQGQYFGSYASQCRFAYSYVGPGDYPRSYYRYGFNPFTDSSSAIYSNSYSNVVLQEVTIAILTTNNCEDLCESQPCDDNAICTSNSSVYCTCKDGFTGSGTKGNCERIPTTTVINCNGAIESGYVTTPNGQPAAVDTSYIDAVAVNVDGLVTQVSFYAAQSCNDNNIYFGAFSALSPISSSTQFNLIDSSGPLSVDRTSDSVSSMKLVTISLCTASSTPSGCQGQAFEIDNGQYFGSYSAQCIMGYAPTSTSVYPSTYYQQSINPFANGAQTSESYSNSFSNVVLQYVTIQPTNATDSCTITSTASK